MRDRRLGDKRSLNWNSKLFDLRSLTCETETKIYRIWFGFERLARKSLVGVKREKKKIDEKKKGILKIYTIFSLIYLG